MSGTTDEANNDRREEILHQELERRLVFLEEADDIRELASYGFDGVEVYHPSHNAGKIEQLEAIAKEYGLLVSGGTDYHGFTGRDMPTESIEIPYEVLEAIKKKLEEKRS